MRAVALVTMVLSAAAWVSCFLLAISAESAAVRATDAALLFVGLCGLTLLSFLIWPRRAP